ncbi:hypothetical protein C8J57DRAFT_1242880 [Mycena rebaudengoi]|nr:hypothetical protein C8J57DRAFT_1242880 [Mycena rebaudengoi]
MLALVPHRFRLVVANICCLRNSGFTKFVTGLPPVAVVTVPRHPWHGYPSRAVEDFSLRKTARKTRPSRPWNGFSVPTLTVQLVSAFDASRVLNMPLNEISEQLKYRNLPRIDGGV